MNIDKELSFSLIQNIRDDVRNMHIRCTELTRFITFTLKPKYYKFQAGLQRELTQNTICTRLKEYTSEFVVTVELTQQGNIHYHAIAVFKNRVNMFQWMNLEKGRTSLGITRVTPNPITFQENMTRSKEYLIKDVEVTSKIINPNMIMRQRADYIFN